LLYLFYLLLSLAYHHVTTAVINHCVFPLLLLCDLAVLGLYATIKYIHPSSSYLSYWIMVDPPHIFFTSFSVPSCISTPPCIFTRPLFYFRVLEVKCCYNYLQYELV